MERWLTIVAAVLYLGGTTSCAPVSWFVTVEGTLGSNPRPAVLGPGASICVTVNPEAKSQSLSEEVASKLAVLLGRKGYKLSPMDEAAFYVLLDFGTETVAAGRTVTERRGFLGSIVPVPKPLYHHRLKLSVIDGALFRGSGPTRVVWRGATELSDRSTKDPEDPRLLLDLLVAAAAEHFGEEVFRTERVQKPAKGNDPAEHRRE